MALFTIDESKCKKDGFCAAECPVMIINFSDKSKVPVPIDGAGALCIKCGHCVAVCPHEALTHESMGPADCVSLRDDLKVGAEQAEQFLRGRRSTRNFRETSVEKGTLEKLIDMARHAPSGHNTQLPEWLVISGRDEVKKYSAMVVDWMRYMVKEQPAMAAARNGSSPASRQDHHGLGGGVGPGVPERAPSHRGPRAGG